MTRAEYFNCRSFSRQNPVEHIQTNCKLPIAKPFRNFVPSSVRNSFQNSSKPPSEPSSESPFETRRHGNTIHSPSKRVPLLCVAVCSHMLIIGHLVSTKISSLLSAPACHQRGTTNLGFASNMTKSFFCSCQCIRNGFPGMGESCNSSRHFIHRYPQRHPIVNQLARYDYLWISLCSSTTASIVPR